MIDYKAMQDAWPKQQAALAAARSIEDPGQRREAVEKVCIDAVHEWDKIGAWPDDWSRFQGALDDIRHFREQIDLREFVNEQDRIRFDLRRRVLAALDQKAPRTEDDLYGAVGMTAIKREAFGEFVRSLHQADVVTRYIELDFDDPAEGDEDRYLVRHRWPEHRKLELLDGKNQVIGEFVEWLGGEGFTICTWRDEDTESDEDDTRTGFWADYRRPAAWIAAFFGIDERVLEQEKRDMLEQIMEANAHG